MEEKVIVKGTLKDSKLFCMMLPILGLLITICYDFQTSYSSYRGEYDFGYGFGNGANYALYPNDYCACHYWSCFLQAVV